MSNIQIETHKDRIVNTSVPTLNLGTSNIELAPDDPSPKPRIEIPERISRPTADSDSSDEGKADVAEFNFAVNKKKFNPVVKDVDVNDGKDGARDAKDTQSQRSVRLPRDSDSERSKGSRRSSGRRREEERKNDDNGNKDSEYKPRYTTMPSFGGGRER